MKAKEEANVEGVIHCIIKHAGQICRGVYENSDELFQYTSGEDYPWQIANLAEAFGLMAVKLEARELKLSQTIEELKKREAEVERLWHAFVETMVMTLDARDPTTAGHSTRLAGYAVKLAEAMAAEGYFARCGLDCSEDFLRELYYAALLHDIGKIGVREDVLLKCRRLSQDRLESIRHKFNCYRQSRQLDKLRQGTSPDEETGELVEEYFRFIAEINDRNYITDADGEKIREIAALQFIAPDGAVYPLLDDFEVENLSIRRGNLTAAERRNMDSHVIHTYEILRKMPWMKELAGVPHFAASHHEKLDGSGYSRGLKKDEIPVQARMLAILDIFEALTARDRPYKPPMPASEVLPILEKAAASGQLDQEILGIFVRAGVYRLYEYAKIPKTFNPAVL